MNLDIHWVYSDSCPKCDGNLFRFIQNGHHRICVGCNAIDMEYIENPPRAYTGPPCKRCGCQVWYVAVNESECVSCWFFIETPIHHKEPQ